MFLMGFGSVFGKSWREFKSNIGSVFWFAFVFYGIPLLFLTLFLGYNKGLMDNPNVYSVVLLFLVVIIFAFISAFPYFGLISACSKKDKYSFGELFDSGAENYWRLLGFCIVLSVFSFLLFILFIIPGIIFSIYWIFSVYIFAGQKKGILASMKESRKIVRGKWWRVFGYYLLMALIVVGFFFVFWILGLIVSSFAFLSGLVGFISSIFYHSLVAPFSIIFLKNFYLQIKKEKGGKKTGLKKRINKK